MNKASASYSGYQPVPLLNSVSGYTNISKPTLHNGVKSANELIKLLRQPKLRLNLLQSRAFIATQLEKECIKNLSDYLTHRTSGTKCVGAHSFLVAMLMKTFSTMTTTTSAAVDRSLEWLAKQLDIPTALQPPQKLLLTSLKRVRYGEYTKYRCGGMYK